MDKEMDSLKSFVVAVALVFVAWIGLAGFHPNELFIYGLQILLASPVLLYKHHATVLVGLLILAAVLLPILSGGSWVFAAVVLLYLSVSAGISSLYLLIKFLANSL